jgi:hypothetical protein
MSPKTRLVVDSKNASWKAHLGKWRTFAAVGGATLAAATNADAGIVYSGPVNLTASYPPNGNPHFIQTPFSINGIKENMNVGGNGVSKGYAGFSHSGPGGLKFAMNASGNAAKKYAFGNPILAAGALNTSAPLQTHNIKSGKPFMHGSFGPGLVTGYVGFKAPDGDLGWLKVQVNDSGSPGYPNEITLVSWAYNNVPGGSIFAGQTGNASVPEPSSLALGLLAAGSVGLVALRCARARAKAAE